MKKRELLNTTAGNVNWCSHYVWDFPGVIGDRDPYAKAEDTGSIPGPERFHMLQSI